MLPVMQMKHKDQNPYRFTLMWPQVLLHLESPVYEIKYLRKIMTYNSKQVCHEHIQLLVETTVNTTVYS